MAPERTTRETNMGDIRKDVKKTADEITKAATDAAYVAIGLGVIGFQKAQVRRQEFKSQFENRRSAFETPMKDFRKEFGKAVKELDKTVGQVFERVDATFEPVSERLPAGAQAIVHQFKETREQLRGYLNQLAA